MEPPTDHRTGTTRMRHREDDALVFPRRPNENLTLDVDSARQPRVFADNVASGGELNMYSNKASNNNNARIFIIGGFCCFLFLLATVSIYTSLNQQETHGVRAIDETKIESDALTEDELIEEAADDEGDGVEDCVGEGDEGNTMYGLFKKPLVADEVIIITEIDVIDGTDVPSEEESVVEEADDLSEATMTKDDKKVFVMEVNGIEFEIGISKDGDFDLPDGLILNPKVREHWLLIEKTLGMGDYEDEEVDESAGDGPDTKLETPHSAEENKMDNVDQSEISGNEQPARMPDGLLFDAPPITGEHEHGEGCEPISVDIGNSLKDLAAGDKVDDDNEKKD